jgi:DNA-binding MarR family transcriptional regulator
MPHLLLKDLPRYDCLLEAAKEFPDLDPSAMEAFLHLLRTGDDVFAVTDHNLGAHHISHGRFGVLMLLLRSCQPRIAELMGDKSGANGSRTPAELAEAAGVTRATMTGLIDTLERDGYVKREHNLSDRRMMSVSLTAAGEAFLRDFLPGHFKAISSLMGSLTEIERNTLVRLLGKIQQQANQLKVDQPTAPALAVG